MPVIGFFDLRIKGPGLRVKGLGFRVQGLGFRRQGGGPENAPVLRESDTRKCLRFASASCQDVWSKQTRIGPPSPQPNPKFCGGPPPPPVGPPPHRLEIQTDAVEGPACRRPTGKTHKNQPHPLTWTLQTPLNPLNLPTTPGPGPFLPCCCRNPLSSFPVLGRSGCRGGARKRLQEITYTRCLPQPYRLEPCLAFRKP